MLKTKYSFDYMLDVRLAKLTPAKLIAHKHALLARSKELLAEASEWKHAYERTLKALRERMEELEYMEVEAGCDRMESDYDFDSVGRIH